MALIAAHIPIGVEAADSFMGLLGDRDGDTTVSIIGTSVDPAVKGQKAAKAVVKRHK